MAGGDIDPLRQPRPESMGAEAAIDMGILYRLHADVGEANARKICTLFVLELPRQFDAIVAGFAAGDARAAARSAHTLASSSALVGALPLAGLCAEIEHLARQDQLSAARGQVESLPAEVSRASDGLGALLAPPVA